MELERIIKGNHANCHNGDNGKKKSPEFVLAGTYLNRSQERPLYFCRRCESFVPLNVIRKSYILK